MGRIRAGIGGWSFAPWRGPFYPEGTRQADELAWASRHVTAIEINSTYYSSQSPATFAKWAAQTPDDFVFSVKASRFCTNRRVLSEGRESIEWFLGQGIDQLGVKLGPILWQFMATKKFDRGDFTAFLNLLPANLGDRCLRHCVEVKNASFMVPGFVDLCRERGVAICCSHNDDYPLIADLAADFAYARLQMGSDDIATGYAPADLDVWARRLADYAAGGAPNDLPAIAPRDVPKGRGRDVFCFFISGGKVRAPAAAMALLSRLDPAAR